MSADQLKTLFRDESAATTPAGISFLSEVSIDQYLLTLSRLEEEIQLRMKLEEANRQLRLALAEKQKCCASESKARSGVRRVASFLTR